jgi:hypothetical protein
LIVFGSLLTHIISSQDQERLFVEPVFAPIRDLVVKLTSNVRALGDGDVDYWFLTGAFTNCKWLRRTIEEGLEQMSPPFGNRRVLRSKNTSVIRIRWCVSC